MQLWTPAQIRQVSRTIAKPHLQRTFRNTAQSFAEHLNPRGKSLVRRTRVEYTAAVPANTGTVVRRLTFQGQDESFRGTASERYQSQNPDGAAINQPGHRAGGGVEDVAFTKIASDDTFASESVEGDVVHRPRGHSGRQSNLRKLREPPSDARSETEDVAFGEAASVDTSSSQPVERAAVNQPQAHNPVRHLNLQELIDSREDARREAEDVARRKAAWDDTFSREFLEDAATERAQVFRKTAMNDTFPPQPPNDRSEFGFRWVKDGKQLSSRHLVQHDVQGPVLWDELTKTPEVDQDGETGISDPWYLGLGNLNSKSHKSTSRQMRRVEDLPRSPLLERYAEHKKRSDGRHDKRHPRDRPQSRDRSSSGSQLSDAIGITREEPMYPVKRGRPIEFKILQKHAPFATRFQMSAFAHALAAPIREDCFTGVHLPISCLLDFKVVDTDGARGEQSLLPVSLAAEMIPTKKPEHRMTEEEIRIRKAYTNELNTPRQVFAGSYMINSEEALRFVSEDSARRVPQMVLSRRIWTTIQDQKLSGEMKWRDDMPEFVLGAMRKIALKKLGYLFMRKANKDKKGMVCAVPGEGLELLESMSEVAFVLRLKPVEAPDELEKEDGFQARDMSNDEEGDMSDIGAVLNEHELTMRKVDGPSTMGKDDDRLPPTTSSTWWTDEEPLHRHTLPLPPPLKSPVLHYPTARYRRRRVPLYDLTTLLDAETLDKMVKGSVFEGTTYVAMAHGLGNVAPGQWLLRLQGFVARRRDGL